MAAENPGNLTLDRSPVMAPTRAETMSPPPLLSPVQRALAAGTGSTFTGGMVAARILAGAAGKQALDRSPVMAQTGISTNQGANSSLAGARAPSPHLGHYNIAPTSAAVLAASYRTRTMSQPPRPSSRGVGGARAPSLIAAASADIAPKVAPAPPRGNYQQAVGVRHEFAGSKQAARGWVQNPIFVLLTAITLCMVCAVEVLTAKPSDLSAMPAVLPSQPPPRVLHVNGDDAWNQNRGGPLSGVRQWLAKLGWGNGRGGLPPTPVLEDEGLPPTPELEPEGLPPALPPGALCSDETKYQLIKLVLGASVAAVTLAVIYESQHEFGCVGQPWMRPPAIAP